MWKALLLRRLSTLLFTLVVLCWLIGNEQVSTATVDRVQGLWTGILWQTASDSIDLSNEHASDHGKALVDWLRKTKGSFFHPDLQIRKPQTDLSSPYYGIYAKDNIQAKELLIEIPRRLILQPGPPQVGERVVGYFVDETDPDGDAVTSSGIITSVNKDGTYDMLCDGEEEEQTNLSKDSISHEGDPINCATVRILSQHMKLGDASTFAPYANYLMSLPPEHLPSSWSEAGRALLLEVMGHNMEAYGGEPMLPPRSAFGWVEEDWMGRCGGADDPIEHHAYMLVMQRSWDEVLVPIYDMMSHRNGRWLNTYSTLIREGKSVKIMASRPIKAGEEIFTSYNFCQDCENRFDDYGTPELLRDYGFVEQYPRRFVFHDQNMSFDIDCVYRDDGSPTKQLNVSWNAAYPVPNEDGIKFLENQAQRLKDLNATDFRHRDPDVPRDEWDVTKQYLDALVIAMDHAIAKAKSQGRGTSDCSEDDVTCSIASDRYPMLDEVVDEWSDGPPKTCDAESTYSFSDWTPVAKVSTPYQELEFETNAALQKDLCVSVDDVVQACTSYRPHYYEMMVHFPAAFTSEMRRVVFIGGSDSMLLHEILKYPTLELVVGLELDQAAVRYSYKYFGTQPHWDNDKVQWWFGEPTKSLRLLPTEYFGSFDLVLIDVSEPLLFGFDAEAWDRISLLVKPKGLLMQSETTIFPQHTERFHDVLHVHFYGIPIICSQSFVIASNGVDFLHDRFQPHKVKSLMTTMDDKNVRYNVFRDYQKNTTIPSERRLLSRTTSHGVVMIVEVEHASRIATTSLEEGQGLVIRLAEELGLHAMPSTETPVGGRNSVVANFAEGYVAIRLWSPALRYAALDIHFWSSFEKQDLLRRRIVAALGNDSMSSSTFRIVAGGSAGTGELGMKGVHLNDLRTQSVERIHRGTTGNLDKEIFLEVCLQESLELVHETDLVVAVLCGQKGSECKSVRQLENNPLVQRVVPLWSCSSIGSGVEFAPDGPDRLFACEKETLDLLHASHTESKIRVIAVDQSTSYSMARVVVRLFQNALHVKRFLDENIFVQASVVNSEDWRKRFVDTFREEIFDDEPVFGSVVRFHTTPDSFYEVAITSSGNRLYPKFLTEFAARMEDRANLPSEIYSLRAGAFLWVAEFEADGSFSHSDYDHTNAMHQWSSQLPLGLQSVLQLELEGDDEQALLTQVHLKESFQRALLQTITSEEDGFNLVERPTIGQGCLWVAHWLSGSAILLWDGKGHIDLNLITSTSKNGVSDDKEDDDAIEQLAPTLLEHFQSHLAVPSLRPTSIDTFPRGINRVILYPPPAKDEIPLWASVS